MAKPLVAIVGRPNVGKSMLFNKLTGHRTSIVEDTPGVTRDRIYGDCEWCGRNFSLVDTGGIEPGTENDMLKFMRRQAEIGIELADAIIMVVDVRSGVTAADQDVATMLRKSRKPVCLAVNKCDSIGYVNPEVFDIFAHGGQVGRLDAVQEHKEGENLVVGAALGGGEARVILHVCGEADFLRNPEVVHGLPVPLADPGVLHVIEVVEVGGIAADDTAGVEVGIALRVEQGLAG